jgi:hypothetical protein
VRHHWPPLTAGQILAWADWHMARTGDWPRRGCGPIPGSTGDSWSTVNMALIQAGRGLPGGDPLAQFLARHRGVPHYSDRPRLTTKQIHYWADDHRRHTGRWPTMNSGPVAGQGTLT